MRPPLDCYAVCPPGAEELTAAELAALGIKAGRTDRGGVGFRATNRQLYAANLWLRTATRVLVRVAAFNASSFSGLEAQAREIDWARWLGPDSSVGFRVTTTGSKLYHTDAIAERLHAVATGGDGAGGRRGSPPTTPGTKSATRGRGAPGATPPPGRKPSKAAGPTTGREPAGDTGPDTSEPQQLFVVRARDDRFTVSVDTSGVPLYKRGWRTDVAKAPLRESLAASLLRAVGWDGSCPLVDPFCGSGTIAIEAALVARNIPPGYQREFAFFDWPSFEPGTWASVIGAAVEAQRDDGAPLGAIVAADRDEGAIMAARSNAARAGVADDIEFRHAAVSDLAVPAGGTAGWVVTNPPYGERLDRGGDLRNLYARFGDVLRRRLTGWQVAMLVADRRLAAHSGLSVQTALRLDNGGIPVELLVTPPLGGAPARRRPGRPVKAPRSAPVSASAPAPADTAATNGPD